VTAACPAGLKDTSEGYSGFQCPVFRKGQSWRETKHCRRCSPNHGSDQEAQKMRFVSNSLGPLKTEESDETEWKGTPLPIQLKQKRTCHYNLPWQNQSACSLGLSLGPYIFRSLSPSRLDTCLLDPGSVDCIQFQPKGWRLLNFSFNKLTLQAVPQSTLTLSCVHTRCLILWK